MAGSDNWFVLTRPDWAVIKIFLSQTNKLSVRHHQPHQVRDERPVVVVDASCPPDGWWEEPDTAPPGLQ